MYLVFIFIQKHLWIFQVLFEYFCQLYEILNYRPNIYVKVNLYLLNFQAQLQTRYEKSIPFLQKFVQGD